jgi:protein-disulfide isomerase
MRAAQAAKDRRRRNLIGGISAAVVLAVVVAGGIAIQANRNSTANSSAAPSGATADYGIVVGSADAPVTVTAYEDFQCPHCEEFEQATAATLADLVSAGTIKITYQPMAFLDSSSTDDYSTRALNAAACVVDADPAAFQEFHDTLFANQPAEGGPGLTDDQLTSYAAAAGAGGASVAACIRNESFKGWTQRATDAASKAGVNSTPTIKVNGEVLQDTSPAGLEAAVTAAAG